MKTSTFSKFSLLCGLALGIMVLWAGASPITEGADSLIGGWYPGSPGYCCAGTVEEYCWEYDGCDPDDWNIMVACVVDNNGWGIADKASGQPCQYGDESCTTCYNCKCE